MRRLDVVKVRGSEEIVAREDVTDSIRQLEVVKQQQQLMVLDVEISSEGCDTGTPDAVATGPASVHAGCCQGPKVSRLNTC
jgi:hypothetical protein